MIWKCSISSCKLNSISSRVQRVSIDCVICCLFFFASSYIDWYLIIRWLKKTQKMDTHTTYAFFRFVSISVFCIHFVFITIWNFSVKCSFLWVLLFIFCFQHPHSPPLSIMHQNVDDIAWIINSFLPSDFLCFPRAFQSAF